MKKILTILLLLSFGEYLLAQASFGNSLHATREGKRDAYKKANGGMELITDINMDQLACGKCHSTTEKYPDGSSINSATYSPGCKDCHDMSKGTTVEEQTCLNCHNRQVYERSAYPDVDVHKKKGMTCMSCHSKEELHGDDGVKYNSLKQPGAIKVKCEDCHTTMKSNTSHTMHVGKVDCAACHAVGVLTCSGCHFETVIATGKNRAINQIKNYRVLVKKDGETRLGAVMSHSYNGKTNFIVSSYHSHAISKNATTCVDCHANMGGSIAAIDEYNSTGKITMNKWNPTTRKIAGPTGVVPLPADWRTSLQFDFVTYTGDVNNLTSDPTKWELLKSTVDNGHLYFAEPLDNATLTKLGFSRLPTSIKDLNELPSEFNLSQNYPNPFNPTTNIKFSLPSNSLVKLNVYDALGKIVATLVNEEKSAGTYEVNFNAGNLSAGVYFYQLVTREFSATKKLLLMK